MTDLVLANCRAHVLKELQDWGEANNVAIGSRSVRAPLEEHENERVTLRYGIHVRKQTRSTQGRWIYVLEFHCLSLRGDLRTDHLHDRAGVLASMILEEFQDKDLEVYNTLGGAPSTRVGTLHFHKATLRNGDARGTVHGADVDYTLETPKTEHVVVTYTATLNR